jgi:tRNA pseudouridine synthase 10
MLGSGRPFVLEVKCPKKRFIDLRKLEQAINQQAEGKVDVHKLNFADKNIARKLKKTDAAKVYRAIVEFDRAVSDEELNRIAKTLSCSTVLQRTPKRVLHRRANLVREKYIYKTKVKRESHNRAEMQIHCQGGLYIKELISGDEDRTTPSVAGIVDSTASTSQLDVLSVVMREGQ